ncbi:hypothetical protein BDE27_1733 [Xenorhabdus ehlersii]|uniref:Uncharacterized protein n=1 Tax=Xenorhabdus ehlersii TaxID=290111 RepID=A0A2D0ILI9_9GAMM|nr:hypothetical protein [Xenorhabdus sp. TS4]PHM22684.1 hypothetical protein Xehl_03450 [Xenorhabdus ehlersii]RKE91494.1 hypothetical protein BDE27_1733 [Xenorhabdus ehlersii]
MLYDNEEKWIVNKYVVQKIKNAFIWCNGTILLIMYKYFTV